MSTTSVRHSSSLVLILLACAACSASSDKAGTPQPPTTGPGSEETAPAQEGKSEGKPEDFTVSIGAAAPLGALNRTHVDGIAAHDDVVLVATEAGAFRSHDAGTTWQELVIADTATTKDPVCAVAFFDGKFFALTKAGAVFASTDDGLTFPLITRDRPAGSERNAMLLHASHGVLLGVFNGKPHRFTDGAWTPVPIGEHDFIDEIATDGTYIYGHSAIAGVVERTELAAPAASWVPIKILSGWTYQLSWAGDVGFAWSDKGGLRRSMDGITWTSVADAATMGVVGHVARSNDGELVLASSSGVYRSADGLTWNKDTTANVASVAVGSRVFVGGTGLYRSEGASFAPASLNAGGVLQLRAGDSPEARTALGSLAWSAASQRWIDVATPGPTVETSDGSRFGQTYSSDRGLVELREEGGEWKEVGRIPGRVLLGAAGGRLFTTGQSWYGATCGGSKAPSKKANDVFAYSDDDGKTWFTVGGLMRIPLSCEGGEGYEDFVSLSGNESLAVLVAAAASPATGNSVYVSRHGSRVFERIMDGLDAAKQPTATFVDGGTAILAYGAKLFQLGADAWSPITTRGLPASGTITGLARVEQCLVAGVDDAGDAPGLYTSCDDGASFELSSKVASPAVLAYRKGSGELLVGTRQLGVWRAPVMRR
jgi:hypothetical protein